VATEDEAIAELTAHQTEMTELRALVPFRDVVAAEFSNEKDPAKIVGTIRELRASVAAAELAAKDAKTKELKATVDATMEKHKAKLTAPLRALMAAQLTTELGAGKKLEETDTVKALESMKSLGIFTQESSGDAGAAGTEDDEKLEAMRAGTVARRSDPQARRRPVITTAPTCKRSRSRTDELRSAAR
jgi:hypothetical protein